MQFFLQGFKRITKAIYLSQKNTYYTHNKFFTIVH
ncbi:MAG: hypothetical protein JWR23_1125 [Mucilaginibacter sp.]|nr:hypothetical protein [Mucilaginibacter sp.]